MSTGSWRAYYSPSHSHYSPHSWAPHECNSGVHPEGYPVSVTTMGTSQLCVRRVAIDRSAASYLTTHAHTHTYMHTYTDVLQKLHWLSFALTFSSFAIRFADIFCDKAQSTDSNNNSSDNNHQSVHCRRKCRRRIKQLQLQQTCPRYTPSRFRALLIYMHSLVFVGVLRVSDCHSLTANAWIDWQMSVCGVEDRCDTNNYCY